VADGDAQDILAQVLIANDGEVIQRLRLSAAEAARVCNVTPRQLIYWTKKGLVKPSTNDDHDYDVFAMEKVIRIRQALEKGYSLEKAAQVVARDLSAVQAEVRRLEGLANEDLEDELRRRFEKLEERVSQLRRTLPASLTIAPAPPRGRAPRPARGRGHPAERERERRHREGARPSARSRCRRARAAAPRGPAGRRITFIA